MRRGQARRAMRGAVVLTVAVVLTASAAAPAVAKKGSRGYRTTQASMIQVTAPGGSVTPIITVGETLGGYRFEAIPDGIAVWPHGRKVDVYVNHETSTVPFPYSLSAPSGNLNDFQPSQVSRLRLDAKTAGILEAEYAIDAAEGYHRFCSSFIASREHGFKKPLLLTNEEGLDWVNRSGMQWPAVEGDPAARQIGVVVAHDVKKGETRPIWGMGRHNHENSVAIPGYGHPVVLSGDDTFTSNPAQSQVYSYIAKDRDGVWNDTGDLWAFAPDPAFAAVNDYYDFPVGSPMSISGRFIKVPKEIATGRNPDGTDMRAADVPAALGGPYPAPPSDGTWSRGPGKTSGPGVDGPQWILEHWSDLNNVFQFVRIEDMAYDKRAGMSNVVYLADSGRGASSSGGNPFTSSNGRIWRMALDPSDPTVVTSLSILIEGDDAPVKTPTEVHQPDNLETTHNGLYITEDPGSSQQFNPGEAGATTARIMRYRFSDGVVEQVAAVDQSADEGPTDVDSSSAGKLGAWEASGIIDVSSIFGPGAFLVTVQAHTLFVETAPGPDLADPPAGPDWTWKREGGQLVLIRIPGA